MFLPDRETTSVWSEIRIAAIAGTGSYVPTRDTPFSDLIEGAQLAAHRALQQARVNPSQIELIVVTKSATSRNDSFSARELQKRLGAMNATGFSLAAAGSDFLLAVENARQWITSGHLDTAMVIAAGQSTEGAGAVVLSASVDGTGIVSTSFGSDAFSDENPGLNRYRTGQARGPIGGFDSGARLQTTRDVEQSIENVLFASGITPDDIACLVPRQADQGTLQALAERLEIPFAKFHANPTLPDVESVASCAIALDDAHRAGRFLTGDYVLIAEFGDESSAAALIQW